MFVKIDFTIKNKEKKRGEAQTTKIPHTVNSSDSHDPQNTKQREIVEYIHKHKCQYVCVWKQLGILDWSGTAPQRMLLKPAVILLVNTFMMK